MFPTRLVGATVSVQKVGANPRGRPPGQVQDLPLPQDIEKIWPGSFRSESIFTNRAEKSHRIARKDTEKAEYRGHSVKFRVILWPGSL